MRRDANRSLDRFVRVASRRAVDVDVRARRVDDLARLYASAGRPVAPSRVPSRRSMSRPRATRRRVAFASVARAREDARGVRRIRATIEPMNAARSSNLNPKP